MTRTEKFVRKTCRFYPWQLQKLERIAQRTGTTVSAVVRAAIDAYDPCKSENIEDGELEKLVSMMVQSITLDLRQTRERLDRILGDLSAKRS